MKGKKVIALVLTGMIAADRTASGDITQMVQIRMELRRLIRGGIGLAVLLLVAFGSGKQLNVVKEEKAPWFEEEFYALSRKYALPEKKRK